jgi:oxygen-independent coproporphyrinogen-3 oxidase
MAPSSTPRAAYVHVPFCVHRCGYCNFTVTAGRDDLIADYLTALERELSGLGQPREVDTLFVGGGTPTHLPPAELQRLVAILAQWFPRAAGHETTFEANPSGLDAEKLDILAHGGVTRISLGAQSFSPEVLKLLERDHAAEDISASVDLAKSRFPAVSLDLIFAVPGQTQEQWLADVSRGIAQQTQHLSTYGLTFEKGTPFWMRRERGELVQAHEDLECDMYLAGIDALVGAGFEHYEVSNFARPGFRCRHNEVYWAGDEYFAVGPGAARYVAGKREMNHQSTTAWLARVMAGQSPVAESETLEPEDRAREAAVFGLRQMKGIERGEFARRTGFELDALLGPPLAWHVEKGLLADDGRVVRLTRAGLVVSDAIWPDFLRV